MNILFPSIDQRQKKIQKLIHADVTHSLQQILYNFSYLNRRMCNVYKAAKLIRKGKQTNIKKY